MTDRRAPHPGRSTALSTLATGLAVATLAACGGHLGTEPPSSLAQAPPPPREIALGGALEEQPPSAEPSPGSSPPPDASASTGGDCRCAAGDLMCAMECSNGRGGPGSGGEALFDRGAARSALVAAADAAKSCKTDATSTGEGRVKLTFSPKGDVTAVTLASGPWAGTPVASCIASVFRGARVPPFDGAPIAVMKTIRLE